MRLYQKSATFIRTDQSVIDIRKRDIACFLIPGLFHKLPSVLFKNNYYLRVWFMHAAKIVDTQSKFQVILFFHTFFLCFNK